MSRAQRHGDGEFQKSGTKGREPHRPVSSPEDVVVRKTSEVAFQSMREMVVVLYKGG